MCDDAVLSEKKLLCTIINSEPRNYVSIFKGQVKKYKSYFFGQISNLVRKIRIFSDEFAICSGKLGFVRTN